MEYVQRLGGYALHPSREMSDAFKYIDAAFALDCFITKIVPVDTSDDIHADCFSRTNSIADTATN